MLKLNILVAYPYMKPNVIRILQENQNKIDFLLDSGAFTAWKAGNEISVYDYISFIRGLPFTPWRYFNLDVIGDARASDRNHRVMMEHGLNPIPIFTRGDDISSLEEMYKHSDIIGLGGLVGTKGNKGFVKSIMNIIGDRKCHWLGFNPKDFIAHYKPYMCDSSSWSSAVRYASLKVYDRNGRWYNLNKQDFSTKPSDDVLRCISQYGVDPRRLAKEAEWKNSGRGEYALEIITCRSWVKYQIDIQNKLGVKFFLACASDWQVRLMLESFDYWNNEGRKYL